MSCADISTKQIKSGIMCGIIVAAVWVDIRASTAEMEM